MKAIHNSITAQNFDSKMTLRDRVTQEYYLRHPNGEYLKESYFRSLEGFTYRDNLDNRKHAFKDELEAKKFAEKHSGYNYQIEYPVEWGKWFDWEFFEVRLYKKGTGHFKFKDEKVWELFNYNVARIKGFPLPEAV